ncbi:hypothetical protein CVT24_005385 [Panaeolus cyanescens]|uniref:C2H2-type domain-containing protein n=1 Tax=Panaeolus cyanescens TaxID=181874 RepID=A0A409VQX4_9AGAR|nr:hypothetical protein CVT24_005385 [Panaeolus cyanescens]
MASWSSSYPPPPRRSRSRSPRGGYASRAGDSYPDQYRPDWDSYDRDRYYDRRDPYDYPRRGRSRSPPPDEGRKRRRSLSPYDRERYEARPRYDDYDGYPRHGFSTSPRRHNVSYPPSRRAPPDPHHFDYPATLKQFADWFRYHYPSQAAEEDSADKAAEQEAGDGSKPRNGIKSRWEKYKKEFTATQLQTMFEHHRKSPWFAEKYDPAPEFVNLRARVRKEGWKGRMTAFLNDLELGKFDPDASEAENEPSSPAKENGEPESHQDVKAEDEGDQDDEGEHGDANGKASGGKRATKVEEVSVPPEGNQVMIRTIPPDIGRVKLEEACSKIPGYVYLALGDPLQKRNFYRAAWLRFKDDADMGHVMTELSEKKIEGFKLHVTHNTQPFVNKVRYAPEAASKPDRLERDVQNAKTLAALLEEEYNKLRVYKAPAPQNGNAEGEGDGMKVGDEDTKMEPVDNEDEPEPRERGSDAVERRIEKVMADLRDQGLVDVNDEKAYHLKKVTVTLDLYLAYLRAAFHTCYYCAVVTDHLEELQRKCSKHVRKPLTKAMIDEIKAESEKAEQEKRSKEDADGDIGMTSDDKEKAKDKDAKPKHDNREWKRNDERWIENHDAKIALLINREGVDPRDYGGKSYEDELSKAVKQHIKQEDEGKFRCKTCQKLFKAVPFVEKHIANKHPELVKQLDDIPYYNNFALDPHRIQPFAHPPPPSSTTNQTAPPQAYGIQGPPPYQLGVEYGRDPYFHGGYPPGGYPPPPAHFGNGYWEHGHPAFPPMSYAAPPPRREEPARRLSDRISGFAPGEPSIIPAAAGLPPKPSIAAMDSALSAGNPPAGRRNNRNGGGQVSGPPPPPPADAKEDPRAAAGKRVSYHDMDLVAEGDVELMY